ncbi:MAG TPA: toluene-4-monooxygenase system B family protein [Polyangiaceae bacterium]
MLVPLYGFVEGDTLGLLVLAHDDMSIAEVASKLRDSARLRVANPRPYRLFADGLPLPSARTVADAGLRPLSRVDLRFVERLPLEGAP